MISRRQNEKRALNFAKMDQQSFIFKKKFTKVMKYQHKYLKIIIFKQEHLHTLKTISHSVVR